ncbi:predicted protein [Meyerozyma guilliermondii ATCC 6260]|uniref:Uncharacterized protein n=1 Tax=Meyerozyma guilliermondii (strain ATCC 6260 / CBS 566 / DSM 6381 / JCM 1539 / NBRC 10279 / NRRL Y-324) TaxID=294746 RepID=A5DAM1_PICGU|nr:uncharacterized protein PGUG_00326 [Meyerozyma guilliermondii ATCC 6260]EDK36228.2 predicted protein [Meyerozyma guilliermondii ATCC 6260]
MENTIIVPLEVMVITHQSPEHYRSPKYPLEVTAIEVTVTTLVRCYFFRVLRRTRVRVCFSSSSSSSCAASERVSRLEAGVFPGGVGSAVLVLRRFEGGSESLAATERARFLGGTDCRRDLVTLLVSECESSAESSSSSSSLSRSDSLPDLVRFFEAKVDFSLPFSALSPFLSFNFADFSRFLPRSASSSSSPLSSRSSNSSTFSKS